MQTTPTKDELNQRLVRLCANMSQANSCWDTAIILGRINQYYLTGTMQDGILIVKKNGDASYFVRRSYERAKDESPLTSVYPMRSYKDAAAILGADCGNTYVETELVTLGIYDRLRKHFELGEILHLDPVIRSVRAVKTPYELAWMERAAETYRVFMENTVPALFREGVSEADFVAELYEKMVKCGHHGVSRFSMFQTEMVVGQVGFGESSLFSTSFNGPGGARGLCPAVPLLGSRERRLKRGDLVFVDIGFGMNGYHSDKTQIYQFGGQLSQEALKAHRGCIQVQEKTASMLRPGAIPEEIYETVINGLSQEFKQNFMGFGSRHVNFLGHGVGLHIDETPVIARGFREPLQENMVIAIEPKKGIPGVGMVGTEDTYIVTADGSRCITGGPKDIILV